MGENEQGGMLRTVVVVGIVAMVAIIITFGVVGLKYNMSKTTDVAVGTASLNKVGDSEFLEEISTNGYSQSQGWYQPSANFNFGSWHVAGKYRNSNYILHTPAAGEQRSDLLSARQEIPSNAKMVSYGAWVKGNGVIQISGFNDLRDGGPGNSWHMKAFNVSDWTYISENNVYMDSGTVASAKYISFDIISYNGSNVAMAQPMLKFTKNIGSIDYMPTN